MGRNTARIINAYVGDSDHPDRPNAKERMKEARLQIIEAGLNIDDIMDKRYNGQVEILS